MASIVHPEFDLHVWKRLGADGKPDVYTIGVWEGQQIRALCHVAPIEGALATLREVLKCAGQTASVRHV